MCGRFTLRSSSTKVAETFGLSEAPLFEPRYNIAPTQPVAAVRATPEGRQLASLRWGLIPSWADDPSIGYRMINARSETVATKPSFRSAFKNRRCLIPADGYYEWQKTDGKKQPYLIGMRDGTPFAFAGLWEHWERGQEPIESCTILTTAANDLTGPIHDRMPVILDPKDFDLWLDPQVQDPKALEPFLRPHVAETMMAYQVSTLVNNPRNEDPRCVEPSGMR
jgi:putative SOS response-associated peptidase YedK